MRKTAFAILICLFFTFMLAACDTGGSNDETLADGAYLPIKDESGTITGYERKYHNDYGQVTRWDVYTADEVYDHYVLYEYDSNNRLLKETTYRADGIGDFYYAYSYTDDGVLAEKDYVTAKAGSERILYDEEGREKSRFTYDENDELVKYELYQNDTWVEAELPTQVNK